MLTGLSLLNYYKSNPDFFTNYDEELNLYKIMYKHTAIDWSVPENRAGRGLVLDAKGAIVQRSYDKFFNLDEHAHNPNLKQLSAWRNEYFDIYPKIDGSLIMISWYKDDFLVTSSCTFDSFVIPLAKDVIEEKNWRLNTDIISILSKGTLIVELTVHDNEIVLSYPKNKKMWIHGFYDNEQERVIETWRIPRMLQNFNVEIVYPIDISINQLFHDKFLARDMEGYVLQFDSGLRLKLKTEWYFHEHKVYGFFFGRINTDNKRKELYEIIQNESIDDLITTANERKDKRAVDFITKGFELYIVINNLFERVEHLASLDGFYTSKEWAMSKGTSRASDHVFFAAIHNKEAVLAIQKQRMWLEEMKAYTY